MTEQTQEQIQDEIQDQAQEEEINQDANVAQADELTVLKERARLMGITFSNNIKIETLRERIAAKLAGEQDAPAEEEEVIAKPNPLSAEADTPTARPKTLAEQLHETQMRLVRCRITCLNPSKKDLPGEILTVANEYIGTVRKYVPFGEVTDEGYHLPYCIYTALEERRFQNIRTVKDRRTGATRVESNWAKEFAIEVLPQLTQEELERLAQAQIAAGSVDGAGDNYLS